MKTKSNRHGHNKGIHEVVSRGYTHIGWRTANNSSQNGKKSRSYDAHHAGR